MMSATRRRRIATLVAVLLGGVLAYRLLFESSGPESTMTADSAAESPRRVFTPIAPTLDDSSSLDSEHDPTPGVDAETSAEQREEVAAAENPLALPFGWVRFDTKFPGLPPAGHAYSASFVREGRFGSKTYTRSEETPLTVGRWRGVLHSAGFEFIELPEFDIEEGKTTELGVFAFAPGTGSIRGSLRALEPIASMADRTWVVDLFGGEVPTCEACPFSEEGEAQPCDRCGRIGDRWHRDVRLGDEFAFAGLLSGRYRIHAHLPDAHAVGTETWVDLSHGGVQYVSLSILTTRELEVDLFDENGAPFCGILVQESERRRAVIRFHFQRDDRPDLTASCLPALPADARQNTRHSLNVLISRLIRIDTATRFAYTADFDPSEFVEPAYVDQPHDHPESALTRRTASEGGDLAAFAEHRDRDPPNRFRVTDLPPELMKLTVGCSSFASRPVDVDLRLQPGAPLRISMVKDAAPPDQEAEILFGPGDAVSDESPTLEIGEGTFLLKVDSILKANSTTDDCHENDGQ